SATRQMTSPVAGLSVSKVLPLAALTHRPPISICWSGTAGAAGLFGFGAETAWAALPFGAALVRDLVAALGQAPADVRTTGWVVGPLSSQPGRSQRKTHCLTATPLPSHSSSVRIVECWP